MATQKKITLPCMRFNTASPSKPKEKSLSFPFGQNVTMPGVSTHAGQVVDADVAALFINYYFKHFQLAADDGPREQTAALEISPQSLQERHDALKEQHETLKKRHAIVRKKYNRLVELTYGMTLDKDMLLQVLGQQGCEGLRFYLCARPIKVNKAKQSKMHLSLVAVGVDSEGFDLNYNTKKVQPVKQLMVGLDSIPTDSVTVEYTTPPPPNEVMTKILHNQKPGGPDPADIDEHYALLKLARANQPPDAIINQPFAVM